jgi:hypothetical protein
VDAEADRQATTLSRGTQTAMSLVILLVIGSTILFVDLLSRSAGIAARLNARDLARFEKGEEFFANRGNLVEFEDRLLVDEIPNADYSRGGVYFFGSSTLKWALKTWELPPAERARVGNYGIGAINHALEFQFIRFLVEDRGLLAAGGERTRIVLGADLTNVADWSAESYFGPLWRRHGLYTYSVKDGIHAAGIGPLRRFIRTEKAHCSGFIGGNLNRAARVVTNRLGIPVTWSEGLKDPEAIRDWIRTRFGSPGMNDSLATQMSALQTMMNYLESRGVGVTIVLLPHRQAFDDLAVTGAYHDAIAALCARRSIPLVDLSHALSEDEFWDINHVNARGLEKTNAALTAIAREHLRRVGLVPETAPPPAPSASR